MIPDPFRRALLLEQFGRTTPEYRGRHSIAAPIAQQLDWLRDGIDLDDDPAGAIAPAQHETPSPSATARSAAA